MEREIKVKVTLGEDRIPESLSWEADESPYPGAQACEAIFLSLWEAESRSAVRIDLWTKTMSQDHMKMFFSQTLVAMAETLERSVGDEELVRILQETAREFSAKAGLSSQR